MNDRHDTGHAGRVEAHRLDGFFDAAFAFAVSVLAIAGTETPHSLHDLLMDLYRIPGFACSFAILLMIWHRHVRWRDRFRTHDGVSIVLSLTLVFFALIFVYPLNMLFQAMFASLFTAFAHVQLPNEPAIDSVRELRALYVCYALATICMASCLASLYRHSLRHTHLDRNETIDARESMYSLIGSCIVAALSLIAALTIPQSNAAATVPGYMYCLLFIVNWITGHWSRKAMARPA